MNAPWKSSDSFQDLWDKWRGEKMSPESLKIELQKLEKGRPPRDSSEAYRFAYLSFRHSRVTPPDGATSARLRKAALYLAQRPADDSAEFAKLRFILEAQHWPNTAYAQVGRRLVTRFPDQPGLKMHLSFSLHFSRDRREQDEAIKLAEELVKEFPKDIDYLLTLADALGVSGKRREDASLKAQAVSMYQKALGAPGLKPEMRTRIQLVMRGLQA
jgi:tetratricopeptide (TPR) repeat protein